MISFLLGLLYFGIAISIIVFVHELGHLMMAKRYGVYCYEFSIGMGPKVKHLFTDKSGTDYVLRAIPIGGYVMMAGEEANEDDKKLNDDQLLVNKKPYQKIIILFAGAFMNFVLAIVLMFLVYFIHGYDVINPSNEVVIINSQTTEKYPAEKAGMESGDQILSVNGVDTTTFEDISTQLNASSGPYEIEYQDVSADKVKIVKVDETMLSCNNNGIGISPSYLTDRYNFIGSIKESLSYNYNIVKMSLLSLKLLFTGGAQVSDLTGPVGIATGSSYIVKSGFTTMVIFIAFLSVSIGFVNILPFPALDGGRIFIALGELITRRKLPEKVENIINMSGIIFLLGLMLFVTFADVYRLTYDDGIDIAVTSQNVSTCLNPNINDKVDLNITATDESNINSDSTYKIRISLNSGTINSYDGKAIDSDTYTFEVTGEELLNNEINDVIVIDPETNSSGIVELQVDVKNNIGITRNTNSMYKEI